MSQGFPARQRQSQMMAMKEQLKNKVDSFKKELEIKKRNKDPAGATPGTETVSSASHPNAMMTKYETINI